MMVKLATGRPARTSAYPAAPTLLGQVCGGAGDCVQIGSDDYCGSACMTAADCTGEEECVPAVTFDAMELSVCVPKNGGCPPAGTQDRRVR